MTDIEIYPVDQLRCRVFCERGIAMELGESLSFFVPGYKFMPKYKFGVWDGKIRMLDLSSGLIFKNLLVDIAEFADKNGYSLKIIDKEKMRPQMKFDPTWIERWAEYGKLQPRDHQILGFQEAMKRQQTLILSPTSSGKSYMMYLMVRYILENTKGKVLISVPSTSLVEQLYSDFQDYAVNWSVEDNVHRIYAGKEKNDPRRVFISTWQSISKTDKRWFQQFESYLCDEAHGSKSKERAQIVENMPNAPVRIGMTGTLDGTMVHELQMRGYFGSVFRTISTAEMIENGDATPVDITAHVLEYTEEERKLMTAKGVTYDMEVDYIVSHERRNEYIANLALGLTGNGLIIFNYIERQGDLIHKLLIDNAEKHGKKIFYIHGEIKTEERERIRQEISKMDNAILLASSGTIAVGVNIPSLEWAIFGHPYKARIRNLQSIGRGLRLKAGKSFFFLHDIGDNFTYKGPRSKAPKQNTLMKHLVARLDTYRSEKFPYRVIDVKLPA